MRDATALGSKSAAGESLTMGKARSNLHAFRKLCILHVQNMFRQFMCIIFLLQVHGSQTLDCFAVGCAEATLFAGLSS